MSLCNFVITLGGKLQSALEAGDREKLLVLQKTQERAILNMTTELKRTDADAAALLVTQAEFALQQSEQKKNNLDANISQFILPEEAAEFTLAVTSAALKQVSVGLTWMSTAAVMLPDVTVGTAAVPLPGVLNWTTTPGGTKVAATYSKSSKNFDRAGDIIKATAEMTGKMAGHRRRLLGWKQDLATEERVWNEKNTALTIARARAAQAQQALAVHYEALRQNQEQADFLQSKFSKQQLYSWMSAKISALYYQAFKLAFTMAKQAELGLQFELPTDQNFISPGHWDNAYRGLLAGESLLLELQRMDKARLDRGARFQEIRKVYPLTPGALSALRTTGACTFDLTEDLFDADFPGHYHRVIRKLSVTIYTRDGVSSLTPPVGTVPRTIPATLIQLGSKTLTQPDAKAVAYLLGDDSVEQPEANVLRINWAANQTVSVTRGKTYETPLVNSDWSSGDVWDFRRVPVVLLRSRSGYLAWGVRAADQERPDSFSHRIVD